MWLGDLQKNIHKYTYSHLGFIAELLIFKQHGLAQLKKLDNFIEIRRKNFNFLKTNSKGDWMMLFLCQNRQKTQTLLVPRVPIT